MTQEYATRQNIEEAIQSHIHDGTLAQQVIFSNLFGYSEPVFVNGGTIATTGNSDVYFMAPRALSLVNAYFSGTDALAASDTNYITWTVTNLGQDGSGSTVMLSSADSNTTKATGGTAITANSKRSLILSNTLNTLGVSQGDRIRIRAAVTGTLANTVTFPVYQLIFQ